MPEDSAARSSGAAVPLGRALERARQDLAAGRPDLARDRLHGFLNTLARRGLYRADAYELLGEIHLEMKDLPRAGAAWLLTSKSGPDVERAVAACYARYGKDGTALLQALSPRAPAELYPPDVQARLRAWGYRFRPYRSRKHPRAEEPVEFRTQGLRPAEVGCAIFVLMLTAVAAAFMARVLGIW
ncbi:MAG: hypothetical protein HS116_19900 [Planctomycetes bacterium]|nr:hypothetical protein [Planctomycetota bacterium]